jgi:hypothetical protein
LLVDSSWSLGILHDRKSHNLSRATPVLTGLGKKLSA